MVESNYSRDIEDITENAYLEMSHDFRERMKQKNKIINGLQKKIIIIYGLLNRFLVESDFGYIEAVNSILEDLLVESIGIQEV